MGFYFESFITDVICAVIFINALLFLYFYNSFSYWQRKDIPYLKPTIPFGNFQNVFMGQRTFGIVISDIYKQLRQKSVKYGGYYIFTRPIFLAVDPELVKQIIVKDFNYFPERGMYYDEVNDPISAHLFAMDGQKWKKLRKKLSPTFSSSKLKMMFQIMVTCSSNLDSALEDMQRKSEAIDIKDISARFTTDVIGSCAFGLDCNSLENPQAIFRLEGRRIFELDFINGLKIMMGFLMPSGLRLFGLKMSKRETSNFFVNLLKRTVAYREQNNIDRKDMLNLLIKLKNNIPLDEEKITKNKNEQEVPLTFNELVAQCFVFFVAGFETTSSTITFALFELSLHQEIQDKLRQEVLTVLNKHNGEIIYEALMEMPYMDQVVNETLRKYPILSFLNRECKQDWTIPGTNKVIEKGTSVVVSNLGLHMDPEYFPDPEKFDPERFSDTAKSKIAPCTYMPFGDGPRYCIGMRFSIMQIKVGLACLLKIRKFMLDPKTIQPVQYDPSVITLSHKYGIWLRTTRL